MELENFGTIIPDIKLNRLYYNFLSSTITILTNEKTDDRNKQNINKERKVSSESSASKVVTCDTIEKNRSLRVGKT